MRTHPDQEDKHMNDELIAAVERASAYIDTHDRVTPHEALRHAGIADDGRGERCCGLLDLNILVAVGVSKLGAAVLEELSERHDVEPTSYLVYMISGDPTVTDMPFVGPRPPRNGYKKEHLCPIVFRAAPRSAKPKQAARR
jgi:hypothetical protein